MRGKDSSVFGPCLAFGITPAYAGKSFTPPLSSELYEGSPPPMRGKGIAEYFDVDVSGITPAYAGKSSKPSSIHQFYQDHPRLCGEKTATKRGNFVN